MKEVAPRCPDDEVLAAFIAGTLPAAELERVSAHLGECPECRSIMGEVARFERDELGTAPREVSERSSTPWWLAAAAVIAVAVVLSAPWAISHLGPASPIDRLAAAAPKNKRTIEARITGFGWAPMQRVVRGAGEQADPAQMKLIGAAGTILEQTESESSASAQHAAGVANLLTDRRSEAIAKLSTAAAASKDARIWSDLAAAHYTAAIRDDEPEHLKDALAAADQALAVDPKLPEALFNRALVLERMGLRDAAKQAWRTYLNAEPNGDWAAEAHRHLSEISQPQTEFRDVLSRSYAQLAQNNPATADGIVALFPQESRTWGEAEILSRWAAAAKNHDLAHAAEHLGVARAIGAALQRRSGEGMLAAAVAAIDSADASALPALVEGHTLYRAGRMTYSLHKPAEAEQPLRDSAALFERGHSPMALVARYYAANTIFDQNRIAEARTALESLSVPPFAQALRAQIDWELALCSYAVGQFGRSLALASSSAAAFDRLGERDSAAFLDVMAAGTFDVIGEHRNAWRQQIAALQRLGSGDTRRLPPALNQATQMAERQGDAAAAQALLGISIETSQRSGLHPAVVDALLRRARIGAQRGDLAAARADIGEAQRVAASIADVSTRRRGEIECRAAAATIDPGSSPVVAIRDLTEAIEFHRTEGRRNLVPGLLAARSRAERQAGRADDARRDVIDAVGELESMRASAPAGPPRWGMFDMAGEIFDDAVRSELEHGDASAAFGYADRNRARLLLDRYGVEPLARPPLLDRSTVLVEYASLSDRLLTFVVREGTVEVIEQPLRREALAAQTDSCARALAGAGRSESACSALYDTLIRPIEMKVGAVSTIVVVPDASLQQVTFAALYDSRRGRYAVEDHAFIVAPSAAVFQYASARQRERGQRRADRVLVIGDARRTGDARLEGARTELTGVTASYRSSQALQGAAATRQAFADAARGADLVHFAGHGVLNDMRGAASLLFAPSSADDGVLEAADISNLALPRTRTVVLAACSTARGRIGGNEGAASVARAFLAAGVPTVVATLWPVDDDAAADFFIRLHRHLAAGEQPAAALRQTQIESIHKGPTGSTAVWAAVEVIGS